MPWSFGQASLAQTRRLAAALRRVSGLALSLEAEHPVVEDLIATLERAEVELAAVAPPEAVPRVGANLDADGRVYLDHSRDIGAFNPAFPEYRIAVDGDVARGTVSFPVLYEGPPGIVHGGFLAVFFDSAIQHHNCDVGVAGKTISLAVRYRRPTPLGTELHFEITRSIVEGRIVSSGELRAGAEVLCRAEMTALASDPTQLPPVSARRNGP